MKKPSSNIQPILTGLFLVALVAAVLFAWLWLHERQRKPIEVVKETIKPVEVIKAVEVIHPVEVERIKEMTKETITDVPVIRQVEVPARLTEQQQAALRFAASAATAPLLNSSNDVLAGIEAVAVMVTLDDVTAKLVPVNRLRTALERILKQNNVRVAEDAPTWMVLEYHGFWDDNGSALTFVGELRLEESVLLVRGHELARCFGTVWRDIGMEASGATRLESALMRDAELRAQNFAKNYLYAQEEITWRGSQ